VCGSGAVVASWSLLIRRHQRARCQAEIPLIALCKIPEPLLGVGAPRNTPADVISKLNQAINAGLASPVVKARLADLGMTVLSGSPGDFGNLIADETEKWGKVIRAANIKAE
jgi:hypothetical protein